MADQDVADRSQVVIFFGDYKGKTIAQVLDLKDGKLRLSQMLETEHRDREDIDRDPRLRKIVDALHAVLDAKAEAGTFLFRCPWHVGILQKHTPKKNPHDVGDHWEEAECSIGFLSEPSHNGFSILCSVANLGAQTTAMKPRDCCRCNRQLAPGEGRDIHTGFNATGDPFGPERVFSTCDKCNVQL